MDKDRQRAKEGFKSLSKQEKLNYILYYYKLHIIACVLVVIVSAWGIHEYASRVNPDLNILFLSQKNVNDDLLLNAESELSKYIDDINSDGKKIIKIIPIMYDLSKPSELGVAMEQKFMVEMAGGSATFFIADEAFLNKLKHNDGVVKQSADIGNSKIIKNLKLTTDNLYGAVKEVFNRDSKNEEKLKEYANAQKLFEQIIEGE